MLHSLPRLLRFLLISLFLMPFTAWGQSVAEVYLVWLPDQGENGFYASVSFDTALKTKPSAGAVHLRSQPSDTNLVVKSVDFLPGSRKVLQITWDKVVLPKADDTKVQIQFLEPLEFQGGAQKTQPSMTAEGEIYSRTNVASLESEKKKELDDALANAKTTNEKNIFAGLNVAAPTSGNTAGNADIQLNRWVSPDMYVSFNLKKSSAENADPKNFGVSFTYRKVFPILWGAKVSATNPAPQSTSGIDVAGIRKDIGLIGRAANLDVPLESLQSERTTIDGGIEKVKRSKLLGFLIDGGGRFEGDATQFKVTNAVFDLPVQLASRTMGLGKTKQDGYWLFRLVPAGIEAGHNLGSDDPTMQNYNIARYVAGGTLEFDYDPKNKTNALPQAISLNLQALDRYLFMHETEWDSTAKKAIGMASGNKPWLQADLKVFLSSTSAGRYGFSISFIRGSLPPVFAQTRAFQFGVIFETADKLSSQGKPSK